MIFFFRIFARIPNRDQIIIAKSSDFDVRDKQK